MNKFIKLASACLGLCMALSMTACGKDNSSQSTPDSASTAPATAPSETAAAADAFVKEIDLHTLHQPASPGDLFTGFWKITEGEGAKLEHFTYYFDGKNVARLLIGTMGFCGTYGVRVKDNKDVFTTQLMFGLDGDYTYEFFKDKNTVTLTNISDNTTTTMQKQEPYQSVPASPENPVIDETLIGAWEGDDGEQLYFGRDGVMYNNHLGVTFSFYTYSAAEGKLDCTYIMKTEEHETATYAVTGDTLNYNGYDYHRISADTLA